MICQYCGNAIGVDALSCATCGAPRTAPLVDPAGSIYEQIGRAVVNREPNEMLEQLVRIGERKDASTTEQKVFRGAKVFGVIALLFTYPQMLSLVLAFGFMWLFWYYLPMKAMRAVWDWIKT